MSTYTFFVLQPYAFLAHNIHIIDINNSEYNIKLRDCRYETIEEVKEAVMKVIDTLTQEDFHGAFEKLLERYNKCIAAGGDYFEGD